MDEQTLEPCPFCGGEARWSPSFIDKRDWGNICCTKCAAGSDYGTRAGTTALWNTRVIAGKVAELRKALTEAAERLEGLSEWRDSARAHDDDMGHEQREFCDDEDWDMAEQEARRAAAKARAALAPYPERRSE